MFSTAQKQPMAWEYCTVYTLHATNGNEAPHFELILDAAEVLNGPVTASGMRVLYTLQATNGNETPTHLELILNAADGRHSPETTNSSMTVYYSIDQWE